MGFPHLEVDDTIIPMNYKGGLLLINIRQPTKLELKECDVVELTSEDPWNPALSFDDHITPEEYHSIQNEDTVHLLVKRALIKPSDVQQVEPFLLYPEKKTVRRTLEATTQLGKISKRIPLRPNLRMRNPILFKIRLMEP